MLENKYTGERYGFPTKALENAPSYFDRVLCTGYALGLVYWFEFLLQL